MKKMVFSALLLINCAGAWAQEATKPSEDPLADIPFEALAATDTTASQAAEEDARLLREYVNTARRMSLEHAQWNQDFVRDSWEWHLLSTKILMSVVLSILGFGLLLTYFQLTTPPLRRIRSRRSEQLLREAISSTPPDAGASIPAASTPPPPTAVTTTDPATTSTPAAAAIDDDATKANAGAATTGAQTLEPPNSPSPPAGTANVQTPPPAADTSSSGTGNAPSDTSEDALVTTLKIGLDGLEITSQITGVIILGLSLAFFYLYAKNVYPVQQADLQQSSHSTPATRTENLPQAKEADGSSK